MLCGDTAVYRERVYGRSAAWPRQGVREGEAARWMWQSNVSLLARDTDRLCYVTVCVRPRCQWKLSGAHTVCGQCHRGVYVRVQHPCTCVTVRVRDGAGGGPGAFIYSAAVNARLHEVPRPNPRLPFSTFQGRPLTCPLHLSGRCC